MIRPSGEDIQNGIKSALKELGEKVKSKVIDFAKEKGIDIAANLVGTIPDPIGGILKDWVLEYKQNPKEILENLVKLDPSEWEKWKEMLDNAFTRYMKEKKKWDERKLKEHRIWLDEKFNEHSIKVNERFDKLEYKMVQIIGELKEIKALLRAGDISVVNNFTQKINEGVEIAQMKFGEITDPNKEVKVTIKDKRFINEMEDAKNYYSEKYNEMKNVEYYKTIGNAFFFNGEYDKALECYNKALNIDNKFKEAWNNKGVVLLKNKNYDEALECFNNALKINPKYSEAWNSKGILLDRLERIEEALKCYEKAL